MDQADMDQVRESFVQAAQMANEAGFDMLHLNFAHGYLLAGFISPLTNLRNDDFGGPLENRLCYPLKVFDAVRAAWPEIKPISVAISATDWAKDGLDVDDAVTVVQSLKTHGCDLVEVLAGQTTASTRPIYGPAFLASFSERLRNETNIPTITSGGITTTDQINSILAGGRADLCIMNPLHVVD
jgi:anthraniloyl-CoA monooxygenase